MQFLDDPRSGRRGWRLLSGNNRPLAMGCGGTRSPGEELAAVRRLVREAEPKLRRDVDGRWRWELDTGDGPDVRCPGVFARRIDARRAFHRFTQAVQEARITSTQAPTAHSDPDAAVFDGATYASSAFIAGVVVAMMVMPIACAVMREVFAQTPTGEREAALALGSTSWGVVRAVVLPFGRGGIIGGTMLGLGRALGETIAVVMIVSPLFEIN